MVQALTSEGAPTLNRNGPGSISRLPRTCLISRLAPTRSVLYVPFSSVTAYVRKGGKYNENESFDFDHSP